VLLVGKMRDKKPKPKKPTNYAKLSQKEKFLAAAKLADADESGAAFNKAMAKLVPIKRKG
jgi:hypothetical protein